MSCLTEDNRRAREAGLTYGQYMAARNRAIPKPDQTGGKLMRRRKYPVCAVCGGEINPQRYDGCERYYVTQDGTTCRYCFLEQSTEYLELNLEDFAALLGVAVVEAEE